MEKTTTSRPIRDLMPEGFTATISEKHGVDPSYVSRVVTQEQRSSYIWPSIEDLAVLTDKKAYAERIKFLEKRDKAKQALKQAQRRAAA
ncbi:hypothetical protein [Rufibacter quisquiliarum]|uniref:Uncharacterized protein n=1 Tax=Rufibacter quisquiliarum TaxID=1549639 RepID=A0A839GV33_9BACT|nr:hypothetical protein [Rufibacter quisquiliarum]MBA9078288.1 hypothetical protein [Rufibacter quisquiliarum]